MFRFRAGVTAVAILVAIPSYAQESALPTPNPRFDVSFGYQGRVPVGSATSDTQGSFGASFGWVSRGPSVALVVLSDTIGVGSSDLSGTWFDYSVLAGPRLRLRAGKRVQPYAQLLDHTRRLPAERHRPYRDAAAPRKEDGYDRRADSFGAFSGRHPQHASFLDENLVGVPARSLRHVIEVAQHYVVQELHGLELLVIACLLDRDRQSSLALQLSES
jgi:hypothetical protein